ncbi:zinc-binding dehydrogenase [Actinoplanes sp. NPDC051494]|uniref:zinc-binding dehydrogenase n=1 Tax=Actinoplanes sp. NPDC051494 TaxID=3363907 RepID=UPI0037956A83
MRRIAVRLAKLLGARVIATTGRHDKEARLRALGADDVVDYRTTPDRAAAVRDLTGGRGADRIVGTGGAPDRSFAAIALSGQIALVGSCSGAWPSIDTGRLLGAAATLRTLAVGSRAQFLAMNDLITEHGLRPVIDRTFGFEEAAAAYRYYESADPFGNVVIEMR